MYEPLGLTARLNGPPRLVGKALVVLCGYRGGAARKAPWRMDTPGLGRVVNVLTFAGLRQFVATYRDHYANPRSYNYQLDLVRSLMSQAQFEAFDVLLDSTLEVSVDDLAVSGAGDVSVAPVRHPESIPLARYETVVLVYPDAIGLSWTGVETRALAAAKESVVVLTGRRRLFTLNGKVLRKLRWRRFLANTRLVQLGAGIVVFPFGAILATLDGIRGHT